MTTAKPRRDRVFVIVVFLVTLIFGVCVPSNAQSPNVEYYFKAKQSGKCAQVDGRSHANGANISQWDCLNQKNVKWTLRPLGNGNFFVVNSESGKCMHVQGNSRENGGNIS